MIKLSEKIKKINIDSAILFDENLSKYTTFKTGGPADIFIKADSSDVISKVIRFAKANDAPLFILGGGANLLVSDNGIRGITLYTGSLKEISFSGTEVTCGSGLSVNELAEEAYKQGLSGLEFIYGMPGTVGGALWMNARCYGSEVSEIFSSAKVIDFDGKEETISYEKDQWAYKISPFQKRKIIIAECSLSLSKGNRDAIKTKMDQNYKDRRDKGHFNAPCAGSVFKNNRAFGKPSGQIIDEAGLRGLKIGGAAVSDFHANIIINNGSASSSDILALIETVQKQVREKTGFELEPEVIPVGDWR